MTCVHEVYASLFNDRAISYRVHNNFDHGAVALSVGVQHMVRSDLGSAGVMFHAYRPPIPAFATWCSSRPHTVWARRSCKGAVNPDEFYVYKPALRSGRRSVLRKNLGGKALKMVYGEPGSKDRVSHGRRSRRPIAIASSLDEADIVALAKQALIIEEHYGHAPWTIEWGKDGATGKIYILAGAPRDRTEPRRPHHSAISR